MPSCGIEFSSFRTPVSDHPRRTSEGLAYLPVFSRGVPRLTFPRAPAMFTPGRLRWRGKLHKMRVILADDHPNFPEIAERVLQPQFKVVAKVADGQRLFDEAMRLNPKFAAGYYNRGSACQPKATSTAPLRPTRTGRAEPC